MEDKIDNGIVFFDKTNAKDYTNANWNAVVFYNYIYSFVKN